jgi:YebC/PmpR family DNA-binding regulatory protein
LKNPPVARELRWALSKIGAVSGHSKWSSIKHKKAATDAKRGKQFTKLARAITVAAREGGGDPDGNPTLATAVQKARDFSMPKDNIQRAIDRGTGAGSESAAIERAVYEGYGPGGAAILVEALTDNRNRAGAEIRHAFEKNGGSLGEPGSVAWIFEKRGVVLVDGERYDEDDLIAAVDAGADDVGTDGDLLKVTSDPADVAEVREALEAAGVEVQSAEPAMEPKNVVEVTDEAEARRLVKLMEALDEHDDVDAVHANFDIPAELLEEAAA